jgi:DNA-3-methyladenine glycosylase I
MIKSYSEKNRCEWVSTDPLYVAYHDKEWGKPIRDNRLLFEFLNLEAMQAGLSWITILKKRENYRIAFDNFDAKKIAQYDHIKIEELMQNAGIIRNRKKIEAIIANAKAYLALEQQGINFSKFIWQFVNGKPIKNRFKDISHLRSSSFESDNMSSEMKKLGFKFLGTKVCYAFMQAVGMMNDHTKKCYKYAGLKK